MKPEGPEKRHVGIHEHLSVKLLQIKEGTREPCVDLNQERKVDSPAPFNWTINFHEFIHTAEMPCLKFYLIQMI